MPQKNIVVIGGGTGTYTVLTGLKKYPVSLTAVVAMADSGGSTKVLREDFGMLPPGSVRPALVALSNSEKAISDLLSYRFEKGNNGLSGHNMGNLILTALTKQLGSFEKAIEEAGRILNIKGRVIPSTLEDCNLMAELENGQVVKGEEDIDVPKHDGNLKVRRVWLQPSCKANPKAVRAIKEADLVVIGPGDLYTSILPNFLISGIQRAVKDSTAKKVYICNLMTKFGETNGFTAKDHVERLQEYTGKGVLDYVLVNTRKPSPERIRTYEKERAETVEFQKKDFEDTDFSVVQKNLLRSAGFIRHDSAKLARAIMDLV